MREAHRELNGVVKKVKDPFWNKYFPPNGWGCRCTTISLPDGTTTRIGKKKLEKINEGVPNLFRMNPAKKGQVFDEKKHPYFTVPKEFDDYKKNNFDLPMP